MGKTVQNVKKDYDLLKGHLDEIIKRKEELDRAISKGSASEEIRARALALDKGLITLDSQLAVMRPSGAPIIYISC